MSTYLDVFDLGSKAQVEGIGDLISMAIIPSCLAVIYLNYLRWEKKWQYVTLFVLISFFFEWVLVQVGYMTLKGWKTWWSLPVYFLIYAYWLPWQLRLLRNINGTRKFASSNKIKLNKIFKMKIKEKAK
ncbi:hypothetical protein ABLT31_22490 [Ammoniphilus sp. 3BR4]